MTPDTRPPLHTRRSMCGATFEVIGYTGCGCVWQQISPNSQLPMGEAIKHYHELEANHAPQPTTAPSDQSGQLRLWP